MSPYVLVRRSGARLWKRSCGPRQPDARVWAIASARRDRELVSSVRLILVISNRVSDLSADPPDACSRAAGQLTRRDARLLQSPRSGSLVRAGSQAAEIAQVQQRRREWCNSIEAGVSLARAHTTALRRKEQRGARRSACPEYGKDQRRCVVMRPQPGSPEAHDDSTYSSASTTDQSSTWPSEPPLARTTPLGENATDQTQSLCHGAGRESGSD
jgi:hypothetical protein